MSVPAAYLAVIVIWSTTPLAIQWSSIGVGYEFGIAMRMLIGLFALLLIVRLRGLPLYWNRHARHVYLCGELRVRHLCAALNSLYARDKPLAV